MSASLLRRHRLSIIGQNFLLAKKLSEVRELRDACGGG
jgi:hypothetical protein